VIYKYLLSKPETFGFIRVKNTKSCMYNNSTTLASGDKMTESNDCTNNININNNSSPINNSRSSSSLSQLMASYSHLMSNVQSSLYPSLNLLRNLNPGWNNGTTETVCNNTINPLQLNINPNVNYLNPAIFNQNNNCYNNNTSNNYDTAAYNLLMVLAGLKK